VPGSGAKRTGELEAFEALQRELDLYHEQEDHGPAYAAGVDETMAKVQEEVTMAYREQTEQWSLLDASRVIEMVPDAA